MQRKLGTEGRTAPGMGTTSLGLPSSLAVPLSPVTGEAGPWHKKGRWGGEDRENFPQSGVGLLPEQSRERAPEPESTP